MFDDNNLQISNSEIEGRIYTIRGIQIVLDRDLAILYNVETRVLKQSVRRNIARFPSDFMFELSDLDIDTMVSQSVIPSKQHFGGAKPFAFTEHGVSMLASILKSAVAVEMSIKIIRAFVEMRKYVLSNAAIFQRLTTVEQKQLKTDSKLDEVFKALDSKQEEPEQGIFFDGQVFDAYSFVSDLIRKADRSIVLIDNYIDDSVLTLFSKKKEDVDCTILTKNITKKILLDVDKFNKQYPTLVIKEFNKSHDRFMIIDNIDVYHIGASLKDLGKKWFAFSKMNLGSVEAIVESLNFVV